MSFATYEEHCLSTDGHRKPFLDTYLEAKGFNKNDTTFHSLAFLAFHLVNAKFRLSDISIYPLSQSAIVAQKSEIAGWQAKLYRFIEGKHHVLRVLDGFQVDFTEMATTSRIPTQEDREFTELAIAGRIGEIPPETSDTVIYAWQQLDQGNEFDSSFNRKPK